MISKLSLNNTGSCKWLVSSHMWFALLALMAKKNILRSLTRIGVVGGILVNILTLIMITCSRKGKASKKDLNTHKIWLGMQKLVQEACVVKLLAVIVNNVTC